MAYIEFLPNEKHAQKGADISDNLDAFKDAGYLLTAGEMVVDIDGVDKKAIRAMMNHFKLHTQVVWTDRGAHLYFETTSMKTKNGICPLGFKVEVKDAKNTPNGLTIKRNGVVRDIENEGVRKPFPDFLKPDKKKYEVLEGLDEGDERNNKLFAHRGKIQHLKDEQKIIKFINNHLFATPLESDELNLILRDIKFDNQETSKAELAQQVMNKLKTVMYCGIVYFMHDGRYESDEQILDRLIHRELGHIDMSLHREIKEQIKTRCDLVRKDTVFPIRFKNGILENGEFYPINYEEFTPYNIDVEYDPKAQPVQAVDDYLNHLTMNDEDYKKEILEMMGHCLITDPEIKRALCRFWFIYGTGGNGKGTMLEVLSHILDSSNISTMVPEQMIDEKYLYNAVGKLANLGDDINNKAINDAQLKIIKNITSGDTIPVRKLYSQSENVKLTCSLIFTTNYILKSHEKGESYLRRVRWFNIARKPKVKDKFFIQKLTTSDALKYWIRLVVEAYMRLYETGEFTNSKVMDDFAKEYNGNNNNIELYMEEKDQDYFLDKTLKDVYEDDYKIWCVENSFDPLGRNTYKRHITERFKLSMKQKKISKLKTTKIVFVGLLPTDNQPTDRPSQDVSEAGLLN